MTEGNNSRLHSDLVKLGDMMGDGLHLEPDGKWIEADYRRVCKALGYIPKRHSNVAAINQGMQKLISAFKCKAGGCTSTSAKQSRSGSMRLVCNECGAKYQAKRG